MGNSASKSPSSNTVNDDPLANTVYEDASANTKHDDSTGKTVNDESTGENVYEGSISDTVYEDASANTEHDDSTGGTVIDESTGDTACENSYASVNPVHDGSSGITANDDSTGDSVCEDSSTNTKHDDSTGKTVNDDSTSDNVPKDLYASANTVHDDSTGNTVCEDSSANTVNDDSTDNIENDEYEHLSQKDVPEYIEEHGVHGIEKLFKAKVKTEWEDVRIKIGITGEAGVGKSSFVNAVRGLDDDHELAAPTGVIEMTTKATEYPFPKHEKIVLFDLPGIGTPTYAALETYCKKVNLETYDTFLILTAERFTENDRLLAAKMKSMKKTFFLIRTKIDISRKNEKHKLKVNYNEMEMLNKIRQNCLKNLETLEVGDEALFLISSHKPHRWDFPRLMQAIVDALPNRQKQCLTLSLSLLTTRSKDIMKRKVKVLRDRICYLAAVSGTCGLLPIPGFNTVVDIALIRKTVNFYKTQLGLPEENSYEFSKLTTKTQKKIREFCVTSAVQIGNVVGTYGVKSAIASEVTHLIPLIGSLVAGSISFSSTYFFLNCCLNDMEEAAIEFLDILNEKVSNDIEQ